MTDFRTDDHNQLEPDEEYLAIMAEIENRQKLRKFNDHQPYEKQAIWHGMMCKVKALFGANRVGKTLTAAYEMTIHLTGLYPSWWKGRRFFRPIEAWCVGVTTESARDIIQKELLGDIKVAFGTGMIPKDLIVDHSMRQGVADTVDTIWVRHVSGGTSMCQIKSNEQGRAKFQGTAKQVIWIDEECDWDVFNECKMRTAGSGDKASGILMVTFTPLSGWTTLVAWLLEETDKEVVQHITIGWDDVPHLTAQEKKDLATGLLPHELEARSKGIPTMATGLIYPIDPKNLLVQPFEMEDYDPGIIGLDVAPVGITAGALIQKDYHSKVAYLVNEHRMEGGSAVTHSFGIKSRFGRFPIRIDPSSNRRSGDDAKNLMKDYKSSFGPEWEIQNAYNEVYSGISRLWMAMQEGRFKVFSTNREWIKEWQNYIWDPKKRNADGHPVPRKKDDHLMDATRYGYWDLDAAGKPKDYRAKQTSGTGWKPLDPITGY